MAQISCLIIFFVQDFLKIQKTFYLAASKGFSFKAAPAFNNS